MQISTRSQFGVVHDSNRSDFGRRESHNSDIQNQFLRASEAMGHTSDKSLAVDERLDLQIGVPVLSIDLVSANVKVGVGEKLGHLVDELLEEFISPFLCGINNGIRSLWIDLVRTGVAGQFWISDKPRPTVAGRIELREDADAAIVRVGHKVAELALRIIHAIGSHLVQLRKALALDAKALVIGEVQVQNVQLYRRHPIHITFEHIERNEVAADVDE